MISTRLVELVIDTVVCLTLVKWETVAGQFGGYLTLSEVAALLRISRGSAYEAAKRKEIPTIRIGRRLLVPSDALERMLSGNG